MSRNGRAWSEAEDAVLLDCYARNVPWAFVADRLPGRTGSSCASRHSSLRAKQLRGEPAQRKPGPAPKPINLRMPLPPQELASILLKEATDRLYARQASERGATVDHVMLSMQFGVAAADLWQAQAA